MRRRFIKTKGLPEVELTDVSSDDAARIERSISLFLDATPHQNKTFCDLLRSDFVARRIQTKTLERLSVWCHTRQPPHGVSNAAEHVARDLLGLVPPRLRGRGSKRVDDYHAVVSALEGRLE